eukprot:1441997-Amphidinium_carterae.2
MDCPVGGAGGEPDSGQFTGLDLVWRLQDAGHTTDAATNFNSAVSTLMLRRKSAYKARSARRASSQVVAPRFHKG